MTRQQIIEEFSHSHEWPEICRKIAKGNDIYHDLFQEFIIALIAMPEDKIIALYENGDLRFYCVRMLMLMHNSSNTPFFRNYRMRIDFFSGLDAQEYDHEIDLEFERVSKLLGDLPWYEREVFMAYIRHGSYRKLSRATGIVAQSIAATVNKVKRKIRKQTVLCN